MTLVYRAYSPTRDKAAPAYNERARAISTASIRNQGCDTTGETPDWIVQQGTVQWGKVEQ